MACILRNPSKRYSFQARNRLGLKTEKISRLSTSKRGAFLKDLPTTNWSSSCPKWKSNSSSSTKLSSRQTKFLYWFLAQWRWEGKRQEAGSQQFLENTKKVMLSVSMLWIRDVPHTLRRGTFVCAKSRPFKWTFKISESFGSYKSLIAGWFSTIC